MCVWFVAASVSTPGPKGTLPCHTLRQNGQPKPHHALCIESNATAHVLRLLVLCRNFWSHPAVPDRAGASARGTRGSFAAPVCTVSTTQTRFLWTSRVPCGRHPPQPLFPFHYLSARLFTTCNCPLRHLPACRMMSLKLMGGHSRWLHAVFAAALVLLMSVPKPCNGQVATAYFEPDIDTTRSTAWPRIPPSPYRDMMGPNCPPRVSRVTTASHYGVFGYPGRFAG